jgi:TonB-linked SusC/RagA family outer membrane protein
VGSNEQGVYRITLPAERVRGQTVTLRVRSIGYAPQQRQVTLSPGAITQDFDLKLDVNRLSEVVVTGTTGATEKAKLAFTVDAITATDLQVPSANALSQLQGKVTGAQIVMPSGRPGTSPAIIMRGPKAINAQNRSQAPLIIVDGVVLVDGGLADLNPQDIESVEVVKGAAASSTYGARAGNGVIQIVTKSGRNAGQGVRFNARTEYGFSDIQSEYPGANHHFLMMDEKNERFCIVVIGLPPCSRTVDFEEEARRINDHAGVAALPPHNFERDAGIAKAPTRPELRGYFQVNPWPVRYDPVAQAVTMGQFNNTNIDMVGRFNNTGFFASASNFYQEGSIRYLDGFRRNSARVNLDQQIGEEWNLQLSTLYSRGTQYRDGEFFRLTRVPAGVNLLRRDSFGRLFVRSNPLNQGSQNENPLWDNEQLRGQDDTDRYLGSLIGRYIPFSWLDFEATASIDRRRIAGYELTDRGFRTTTATGTLSNGELERTSDVSQQISVGMGATARKSNPLGIQGLDGRLHTRMSFEREDIDTLTTSGTTLAVPGLLSLGNATVIDNPSSGTGSVRALAALGGIFLDYKGRYIADALLRYDGSSLFGAEERWAPYYRASLAWRASEEPWWFAKGALNEMKFRASVGTAGGRPSFSAQYETFSIGAGGTVTGQALGNKFLKPETTTEVEVGIDAELFSRYGLQFTYAHAVTKDQIIPVPPSVSSGFSSQWKNAGELTNKTLEVSLNIPVITNNKITWTSRLAYDRNRTHITALGVPPFFQATSNAQFRFGVGERIGTVWGKFFVTSCAQLPAQFRADCGGTGKAFQKNSDGWIVWTGGHALTEGITKNLFQAVLPGCLRNGVAVAVTGEVDCRKAGGTVNNPWAIPGVSWGMPMVIRDSLGNPAVQKLGNTLPDFRLSMSHNFQYKRFNVYALVDGSYGNRVFNQEVHWSLGDFNVRFEDQADKTVETAKPIGYYWRAPAPEAAGIGGYYDVLGSNNFTTMKGTYTKLREASISYAVGPIRGVGDWSVSLIGRNLWTITDFLGWDPEVGVSGTNLNSSAITAVAGFQYPQTRTFTFAVGTRF